MLTKYGTENIIAMLAGGVLLLTIGFLISKNWISVIFWVLGGLLILFTLWFFRDPEREVPKEALEDSSLIISPADGKVVQIVEEPENVYLKQDSKRISIFLSPLDVHVNRIPANGKIEYFEYIPGKYLVAYHPKSSLENEQTHIGLKNEHGQIFFKQIVGIVARRLAWDIKTGDTVNVGDRFGMMKFGSRMDVALPKNSEIFIKNGQTVVAGETILAKLKK